MNEQSWLNEIELIRVGLLFAFVNISVIAEFVSCECEPNVVCENSAYFISAGNESILSELFEVVR